MLPLVAGLVFWFLTAPELRFASAMFLLLPVTALLLLLAVAQNRMKPKLFAGLVGLVLVAGNLHLFHFIYQNSWVLRWVAKSGWENITQVAIEEKVTKSGLHVFTPREGDQCWDTKLICTPNFNRNLRQRDPEHLEAGFTVRPGAR